MAELLDRVADAAIAFLEAQVRAGAQAVQLFDTSVGWLPATAFVDLVLPRLQRVCQALAGLAVPRLYFPLGGAHLLPHLAGLEVEVLSVDWRVDLGEAWARLGGDVAIQGNLDPVILLGPTDLIQREVKRILEAAGGRPGHIFNLGHGILPQTPVDNAVALVDAVHEMSRR
jgi:uroporphyrinogen decarboxylase